MQSLVAIEGLWIPIMLNGSFDIWAGPVTENHEKMKFCHFQAATAFKSPLQSRGALRSRAMFKYNLQREAAPLEVILDQG